MEAWHSQTQRQNVYLGPMHESHRGIPFKRFANDLNVAGGATTLRTPLRITAWAFAIASLIILVPVDVLAVGGTG